MSYGIFSSFNTLVQQALFRPTVCNISLPHAAATTGGCSLLTPCLCLYVMSMHYLSFWLLFIFFCFISFIVLLHILLTLIIHILFFPFFFFNLVCSLLYVYLMWLDQYGLDDGVPTLLKCELLLFGSLEAFPHGGVLFILINDLMFTRCCVMGDT